MSERKRRGPGICYSFQRGECARGDNCRYLHETQERRKTGICYSFQRGECTRGDNCRYLHEIQERKRTGVCYSFQRGECNRGDDCRYLHETTQRWARELPPKRYVSKYPRGTRYDKERGESKLVEPEEPAKPAWVPKPSPPGTWAAIVAAAGNKEEDAEDRDGEDGSGSEANE